MFKLNLKFLKKLPEKERRITLATVFTLIRIILVPFIVFSLITYNWKSACVLFFVAAVTDTIDGSLARIMDEQTVLGACLDPIADKLLILSCFFTLASLGGPLAAVPFWFVVLVIFKEIIILGGIGLLYRYKGTVSIAPTFLGKLTTAAQLILIGTFFARFGMGWVSSFFYHASLIITSVLVCLSFIQYVRIGLNQWFNRNYL